MEQATAKSYNGGLQMRTLFAAREMGVLAAFVIICLILTVSTDSFLTVRNLLNVGRQVSLIGIMAIGMTFVLISREVDLSIGSVYALSGLLTGMLLVNRWQLVPAIGIGLCIGAAAGLVNGMLSTIGKLPSFIATLGMLSVVRGIALLITDGQPITIDTTRGGLPEVIQAYYFLGQGLLFGTIPMLLTCFAVVAAAAWFLLAKTSFGFRVYAVGGS